MTPQRITPRDAAQIIEDLEDQNDRDFDVDESRLPEGSELIRHREQIIKKLKPIARQAVSP